MNKIISIVAFLCLISCQPKGTIVDLSHPDHNIQIYKYYYKDGYYVYVSKFRDSKVNTITWNENHGKNHRTIGNVILENDSIVILKK